MKVSPKVGKLVEKKGKLSVLQTIQQKVDQLAEKMALMLVTSKVVS